jgi:hypothetical protein
MGPADVSTTDNTTIKVTQLLKLASDGENWLTYQERVSNAAAARGLRLVMDTGMVTRHGSWVRVTTGRGRATKLSPMMFPYPFRRVTGL